MQTIGARTRQAERFAVRVGVVAGVLTLLMLANIINTMHRAAAWQVPVVIALSVCSGYGVTNRVRAYLLRDVGV